MSSYALKLTSLRFRHFKPVAPERIFRQRWDSDGRMYLSMKDLLIQGANPYDAAAHQKYGDFQGGYRCDLTILTNPSYGIVTIADDKLGLEYTPNIPNWSGHDAFSYKLTNSMGQDSDANCIHLFAGV